MKVLIVCSFNKNRISHFILEQVNAIKEQKIAIDFFGIKGHGFTGYIKNYPHFLSKIKNYNPDLIHAHFGLSGLLANLQRKVPVVTTFHGSDVNNPRNYKYSRLAHKLSSASIFVNQLWKEKKFQKKDYFFIPCAVDMSSFKQFSKYKARQYFGYEKTDNLILFSSSFTNKVKNYPLADQAINLFKKKTNQNVNLLELKNYSREEVNLLLNCSDCALLTSFSEGSPQFIKEAMACNCPVVATDVGDISWLFGEKPGHFLTTFDPQDVAAKLQSGLEFSNKVGRTNGRQRIIDLGLDSETVTEKIIGVYDSVLNKNLIW